jgi:hypothetical protein
MATSRIQATNENISTFGAAGQGRDYTVLDTWAGDTELDLVGDSQSEVLECYADSASFNEKCVLEAATTDEDYFRIVRPAAGEGHDGIPGNGLFFDLSGSGGDGWRVDEEYSGFQDIVIKNTTNDASGRSVFDLREANGIFVGCMAFDSTNIGVGVLAAGFEIQEDDIVLVNCLALNNPLRGFDCDVPSQAYAYNCNAINNGTTGFLEAGGDFVVKNCLGDNNTVRDFGPDPGSFTGATNNAAGDGFAPGTNNRENQTFTFVASGSDDYHLTSDDAGALDFGADLSADGVFPFNDDIDFETRATPWDIGFDEFLAKIAFPVLSDREIHSNIFGNRIVR